MTCLKKNCHFRCVQEGPGTHSFRFPSVHWWEILGPAWHNFSACPIRRSKFCGRFGGSNSTHYWSFCQTSIRPYEIPHFGHIFLRFWRARSSRTRFVFHTLTAIQKCFMPPKNLCHWYSVLSISPFQFFVSFCCVFIKFDTKFDRATLLEISFLHFRIASLLHTLTQLAVKSDVLVLSSWNLHWSSSKNVCLGWCLRCGYSFASCRATHSVSLLSWRTTYVCIEFIFPMHAIPARSRK